MQGFLGYQTSVISVKPDIHILSISLLRDFHVKMFQSRASGVVLEKEPALACGLKCCVR
jgi:hypothetical protein